MKCRIIAETAFTHEGNIDYLIDQVKLAQSIGAGLGAFTAFQGFGNNQGR